MNNKLLLAGVLMLGASNLYGLDMAEKSLFKAIRENRPSRVVELLKENVNPNITTAKTERTPLYLAVTYGDVKVVKDLLEHGANPNLKDRLGDYPLTWVAHATVVSAPKRIQITKDLLKHGADPNVKDRYGRTPLSWAVANGNTQIIKDLLELDANPNIKDDNGDYPLTLACREGNANIVYDLLKHGSLSLVTNGNSLEAFNRWKVNDHRGFKEVIDRLKKDGIDTKKLKLF